MTARRFWFPELARRVLHALAGAFLAFSLAGAAALIYLNLVGDTRAQEVRPAATKRLEVLGGNCHYDKVGNYVWYNEGYPYQLDMTSGCAYAGISSIRNGKGWRVAYVTLGSARTHAIFPLHDPDQPFLPDGSNCDPATLHGCLGLGIGEQSTRGASFGPVREARLGEWTAGYEGGLFLYEGTWRIKIYADPLITGPTGEWTKKNQGMQLTPYIGLTLRYGYAMAMVRAYGRIRAAEHGCGACSGVANGTLVQALIGASIPF